MILYYIELGIGSTFRQMRIALSSTDLWRNTSFCHPSGVVFSAQWHQDSVSNLINLPIRGNFRRAGLFNSEQTLNSAGMIF
jgi:hypothetical protein